MARADVLVEEILVTLRESPLRAFSVAATEAVADLPDRTPGAPEERVSAAMEQIDAIRRALAPGLKRELEALRRLPGLAERLGVSEIVLENETEGDIGGESNSLTDGRRTTAIKRFLDVLDITLSNTGEAVRRRENPAP